MNELIAFSQYHKWLCLEKATAQIAPPNINFISVAIAKYVHQSARTIVI